MRKKLPVNEDLDFAYILELMMPMHNTPEFSWLPELFSTIGYESLLKLCKYAGGETITIPTLDQLTDSIDALQYFYDIEIKNSKSIEDVPKRLMSLYQKIHEVYHADDYKTDNT